MRASILLSSLAAFAINAVGLRTSHREGSAVVESVHVPSEWEVVGKPDPSTRILLRIALTKPNQKLFHQTLLDIATPNHRNYGKHLKREELKALLRPTREASAAVLNWLKRSGVSSNQIENDGEWINFVTTVGQAEIMLDTEYQVYRSTVESANITRTDHYSVPKGVRDHVSMIQPTTRFGGMNALRSTILYRDDDTIKELATAASVASASSCRSVVTPACLIELYNIEGYAPKGQGKGFMGVPGFLDQYARTADLAQFLREFRPEAAKAKFDFVSINGGLNLQNSRLDSTEANLDIQYSTALSYPLRQVFYSTPGRGPLIPDLDEPDPNNSMNEPWLEFFTYLSKLPDKDLPHTMPISYGENEQTLPASYTEEVCNLIGGLGARGVSILFASGDTGVTSACQTNDGNNTTRFLPIFPAACPYVTSVGGTTGVNPERAASFSSGGFSDRFPRPEWQKQAATGFLSQLGSQWNGLYNPEGRGFPDIAAQASSIQIVDKGRETAISGTSASAPIVGAMIALLNEARLEAGMRPMGFLNPWLYSVGHQALTDIVSGGSTGCTGRDIFSGLKTPVVPGASWKAVKGWDPVTGLGTPDFSKLLKLATTPGRHWERARGGRRRGTRPRDVVG